MSKDNNRQENTGMKRGTIDPSFKRLREEGVIVGDKGRYVIPNMMVVETTNQLKEESSER
jgi:hypothetical protein